MAKLGVSAEILAGRMELQRQLGLQNFLYRIDIYWSLRRGNIPDSVCYPQPKINELSQLADFWY